MCKICNNENLEGFKGLDCHNCPFLTNIPNIEGLKELYCYNCPLLTDIPNIEGLERLNCFSCSSLIIIPNIKELIYLCCEFCPLLTYIPKIEKLEYDEVLLKLPFKDCKFLISEKMERMYNNIYYLWKKHKLNKYINYLEINYYSNPELPYMKYYINNELYNEYKNGKIKIGFINSKNELIWYKLN